MYFVLQTSTTQARAHIKTPLGKSRGTDGRRLRMRGSNLPVCPPLFDSESPISCKYKPIVVSVHQYTGCVGSRVYVSSTRSSRDPGGNQTLEVELVPPWWCRRWQVSAVIRLNERSLEHRVFCSTVSTHWTEPGEGEWVFYLLQVWLKWRGAASEENSTTC